MSGALRRAVRPLPRGGRSRPADPRGARTAGDAITRELYEALHRTFSTPMPRGHLLALARALDDVADAVEEAATELELVGVQSVPERARAQARVVLHACERLADAVERLRDRPEPRGRGRRHLRARGRGRSDRAGRARAALRVGRQRHDHDAGPGGLDLRQPQARPARRPGQGSAALVVLRPPRRAGDRVAAEPRWASGLGLEAAGEEGAASGLAASLMALRRGLRVLFLPGALAGGVLGWFIIRPVNWALGISSAASTGSLTGRHGLYGKTVGWSLRLSAIVLILYVGPDRPDGLWLHPGPVRLHPQPGQGPPDRQRPVARLRLAGAHGRRDARGRKDRAGNARRCAHGGQPGPLVRPQRHRLEPRLHVHHLEAVRRTPRPRPLNHRRHRLFPTNRIISRLSPKRAPPRVPPLKLCLPNLRHPAFWQEPECGLSADYF